MKQVIFGLFLVILLATACGPAPSVSAITPPYVDTGIDPESWETVPAGEFPFGQHDHMTMVDYDFQIMVTDVTVEQYATFLNDAMASGDISVGEFELEAGETIWSEVGAGGFYEGDPFDGYKHEEEIKPGDKPGERKSTAIMPIFTLLSISLKECSANWVTPRRLVSITAKPMIWEKEVTKHLILPAPTVCMIWPETSGSGWGTTTPTNTIATCALEASIPTKWTCVFGRTTALAHSTTARRWDSGAYRNNDTSDCHCER
jgi:hypothetical protein